MPDELATLKSEVERQTVDALLADANAQVKALQRELQEHGDTSWRNFAITSDLLTSDDFRVNRLAVATAECEYLKRRREVMLERRKRQAAARIAQVKGLDRFLAGERYTLGNLVYATLASQEPKALAEERGEGAARQEAQRRAALKRVDEIRRRHA